MQDLSRRFDYHPPLTDEKKREHEYVRKVHRDLAEWMDNLLPEGREKSLVILKLEESMFWANAALARDGK